MKKSDLFKIGVLLVATTLGTTGCSFGEDEKKPEIVVDPAEKTIEYYIAGKVTEGSTALPGVEVKAGGYSYHRCGRSIQTDGRQ